MLKSKESERLCGCEENKKRQAQEVGVKREGGKERKERERGSPVHRPLSPTTERRVWLLVATHGATVARGALLLPACLPLHIQ